MLPQFRKKDAQRRAAMITRSLTPLLSVFTEWATRRSNRAGTKVGTVRGAQFSAITVHAAPGEKKNRVHVTSLEGPGSVISYSRKLPARGRTVAARSGEAEAAVLGKKTCERSRPLAELRGLTTSNITTSGHEPCGRKYARSSRP